MTRRILLLGILALTATRTIRADDVFGKVIDESHAPIKRATVTLTSLADPAKTYSVDVRETGEFTVGSVLDGAYEVSVKAPGFAPSAKLWITAHGRTWINDVVMHPWGCILLIDATPAEVPYSDDVSRFTAIGPNQQQWLDSSNISRFRLLIATTIRQPRRRRS